MKIAIRRRFSFTLGSSLIPYGGGSIISKKEIAMLRYILEEGIKEGRFEIEDPYRCAVILTQAIGGLDVPYIRDNLSDFGIDKTMLKDYMTNVILNGIIKR